MILKRTFDECWICFFKQVRTVVQNVWNQDLEFNAETRNNDWIILKLDTPLDFNDEVQPVCLPSPNWAPNTDSFNHCFVSGWGNSSNTLQWIDVSFLINDACKQSYESISNDIICTGYAKNDNDSCFGNSGEPLVCLNDSRAILTGISSFGHDCSTPENLGIYFRVTKILDWVESNLVCFM